MLANQGIGEWGYAALIEVDGKKIYSLKDLKEAFDKSGDYVTFRGLYSEGAMASFSFSW